MDTYVSIMRPSVLAGLLCLYAFLLPCGVTAVPQKNSRVPAGFVTTNGREFELDGKPFVRVLFDHLWPY